MQTWKNELLQAPSMLSTLKALGECEGKRKKTKKDGNKSSKLKRKDKEKENLPLAPKGSSKLDLLSPQPRIEGSAPQSELKYLGMHAPGV
ncbi:unnamed protein product [Victoria cruziana]